MAAGSSINWALVNETNASQSTAYSRANSAYNLADSAYDRADDAYYYADDAYDLAWDNRLTDLNVFNVLTSGGTRFGICLLYTSLFIGEVFRNGQRICDFLNLSSIRAWV